MSPPDYAAASYLHCSGKILISAIWLIDIKRSIFLGVVGHCKNETSRQSVPLSLNVAADLWLWKETTPYAGSDDWVFASPRRKVNDRYRLMACYQRIFV